MKTIKDRETAQLARVTDNDAKALMATYPDKYVYSTKGRWRSAINTIKQTNSIRNVQARRRLALNK